MMRPVWVTVMYILWSAVAQLGGLQQDQCVMEVLRNAERACMDAATAQGVC